MLREFNDEVRHPQPGLRHINTSPRAVKFFLVGVEQTPTPIPPTELLTLAEVPSSSKVTIFSLLLAALIASDILPPICGPGFLKAEVADAGLSAEAGGGGTAISLTAAAKLNSLTLRGTKYSKCPGGPSSGDIPGPPDLLKGWPLWKWELTLYSGTPGSFFLGREWCPGDGAGLFDCVMCDSILWL